jgi:DNA (cytosine-5)-methyltransferase 1
VTLTVGSLFAGIGGFDLGLERAGMEIKWSVENDKFCNKVRRRHWPDVPQYGDITALDPADLDPVDIVVGGWPCQGHSIAGNRQGLGDDRSGLFWEIPRLLKVLAPQWILLENVPGALTSGRNKGDDFAAILRSLDGCGYGLSWRVLDARHFPGIAQRRERLYIVGRYNRPCPPEILFDAGSMERHPAPRPDLSPVASTIGTSLGHHGYTNAPDGAGVFVYEDEENYRYGSGEADGIPSGLDFDDGREPDGPRYRALGNAVTVPVITWIGRRIEEVTP